LRLFTTQKRADRRRSRMIPEFSIPLTPNGQIMNGLHFLIYGA
jgi:hypothetical protein